MSSPSHELSSSTADRQRLEVVSREQGIQQGFLSHTGQDATACRFTVFVKDEANRMGLPCFCDYSSIPYGVQWEDYIEKSVLCSGFVAVLSPTYFERYWCMRELDLALEHSRPILPVYYDLSGPEELPNNKDSFCAAFKKENKIRLTESDLDRWWNNISKLKKIQSIRRTEGKGADLPVRESLIKWLMSLGLTYQDANEIRLHPTSNILEYSFNATTVEGQSIDRRALLIGRDSLVSSIRQKLDTPLKSSVVAVVGGPGVGKTHICLEVACTWGKGTKRFVYFLNSQIEMTMKQSYQGLLAAFGINVATDSPIQKLAESVLFQLKAMEANSDYTSLLVYDNVSDLDTFTKWFLPQEWNDPKCWKNPEQIARVLLASPDVTFTKCGVSERLGFVAGKNVETLDTDDAVKILLQGISHCEGVAEKARILVRHLDCLPVSIVAANGWLKGRDDSPEDVSYALTHYHDSLPHDEVVDASIKRAFRDLILANPACERILRIAAYASPDRIECELFVKDGVDSETPLYELVHRNLLRIQSYNDSRQYRTHRTYQMVARHFYGSYKDTVEALEFSMSRFDRNNPEDVSCWKIPSKMVRHVDALLEVITPENEYLDCSWARLLEKTGFILRWTSQNLERASYLLQRSLAVYKGCMQYPVLDYVRACSTAGRIKKANSENEDALKILVKGMSLLPLDNAEMLLLERIPAQQVPTTQVFEIPKDLKAELWDDIGRALQNMGWKDEVEQCFNFSYALRKENLPPVLDTALSHIGEQYLLGLLSQTERRDEILACLEQNTSHLRTGRSGSTANTWAGLADTEINLARYLRKQGRYAEAQQGFQKALGAQWVAWKDRANDSIVTTLNHLGRNSVLLEETDDGIYKAKEILEAAHTVAKAVFGDCVKNIFVATCINNVAMAIAKIGDTKVRAADSELQDGSAQAEGYYWASDDYEDALKRHQKALAMLKEIFLVNQASSGQEHKKIKDTYQHLLSVCERARKAASRVNDMKTMIKYRKTIDQYRRQLHNDDTVPR